MVSLLISFKKPTNVPTLLMQESLHKDFGKKIGDMLWNYCRGIDHSVVEAVQVEAT
jgi:nucleotidyltransferase/DNA polymerase involved in DNA repair